MLDWAAQFDAMTERVNANQTSYPRGKIVSTNLVKRHRISTPLITPVALPEMGNKIRLASTHAADEVWVSRRLTQMWLPTLRKLAPSRQTLRGEGVKLKRKGSSRNVRTQLYSADLSAATDWIHHSTARRVARVLNKKVFSEESASHWDDVAAILLGPHTLVPESTEPPEGWGRDEHTPRCTLSALHQSDGSSDDSGSEDMSEDEDELIDWTDVQEGWTQTSRGIHMGLGPSWIILSLLNTAAGMYASGDAGSFRVCGDDLIALWTRSEVDRYESFLTTLGLKINVTKSFLGEQGVFCENLVIRTGDRTAESRDCGHIAEAAGSKEKAMKSHHPLEVAHALRTYSSSSKPLIRLAQLTRRSIGNRYSRLSGPLNTGGNGFGSPHRQVLFILEHGSIGFTQGKPRNWRLDLESASVKPHEKKRGITYISRIDASIALDCEERVRRLVAGEHPQPPKAVKPAAFRRRTGRITSKKAVTWGQVRELQAAQPGRVRKFIRQFRR